MTERYLYPIDLLPQGFKFPSSYIDFISVDPIPDLDPWWFLCESKELADSWFRILRKQYPTRNLVPFAKLSLNDDIACFDGDGKDGNPRVLYVHSFALPGWEDRGSVSNFEKWLEYAIAESEEYRAENGDNPQS